MQSYINLIHKHPEYIGNNRYCNICGYRFSKFKLFNKLQPREAQCPVCGSLERHRHLYIYLSALFPTIENKKILHFAPESIIKEIFKESPAKYFDADIEDSRATYKEDITNISFEDNFFDYIFCIHVLEHISDDIKAMRELQRVLKPNGIAFLCVPLYENFYEDLTITDPKERERLFGQFDHVRKYDKETFEARLKMANFYFNISEPSMFPKTFRDCKLGDSIYISKKYTQHI